MSCNRSARSARTLGTHEAAFARTAEPTTALRGGTDDDDHPQLQLRSRRFRTTLLLGGLTGLLVVIGALIGGPDTALLFLGIAAVMNLGAYWFSDKLALKMSGAQPMTEEQAPRIYEMVRELTTAAKMPMPALYVIPQAAPNAFATGRSPRQGRGRRHGRASRSCSPRTSCAA